MRRAVAVTTSWLMTAPAVLAAAWVLVGVPLLIGHAFRPQWQVPAAMVVAVPMLLAVRRARVPELPWGVAAVTVVAVAVVVGWDVAHASENLIVRRDPGPYGLITHWIAQHGTMSIPDHAGVFGHDPALSYDSPGFYTGPDGTLQPQFQSGPPLVFAPGVWIAGLRGGLAANAVIAGLGVMAVAGLVARFTASRWVPFTALVLAVVYPDTHVARSPYSESLDQLILFGGLSLLYGALALGRVRVAGRRLTAERLPLGVIAASGLVLGSAPIARLDAYADLLPIVAVPVLLACLTGRRALRAAGLFSLGLVVGLGVALADDRLLHDRYVHDVPAAIGLLVFGWVAAIVLTPVSVALVRWRPVDWWAGRVPAGVRARVPAAGFTLVIAAGVLLWFVRPWVQHPLTFPGDHAIPEVAALQRAQGLPVDGRLTYAEWSMSWLAWWFGPIALGVAVLAAALLVRRHLRGRELPLLPMTLIALIAAAIVLKNPHAAGDHPWVERRFVPVVLPALVVAVTWLLWRFAARGRAARSMAVVAAVAVAVPTIAATAPLWGSATEQGQIAAMDRLCRIVGPDAAVVFTDNGIGQRIAQTMRDLCDVPTARLRRGTVVGAEQRLAPAVAAAGRRLVFLGGEQKSLGGLAPQAQQVLDLRYPVDKRLFMRQPTSVGHEELHVWLVRAPASGGG